jgi:hypothetical protein
MLKLIAVAIAAVLLLTRLQTLNAQDAQTRSTPSAEEVRVVLRAFYFALAHREWEALMRHTLPAKVTTRWIMPDSLLTARANGPGPSRAGHGSGAEPACHADDAQRIAFAAVRLGPEWASARVPACADGSGPSDEFRFLRVQGAWRIVYIALRQR